MISVAYFKNDKCGICTAFLPKIKKIANDYRMELKIIDIAEKPEIAGQNMVFTVPTIIFFDKNGNELKRFVRNFSEFEIRDFLDRIYDILNN